MSDPNLDRANRTKSERTGDNQRPYKHNHSKEHEERIKALCAKTQTDYFDSGVYKLECSKDYG